MMQGDQFRLPIELKNNDGSFVTQESIRDLEVFVGKIRKTLLNKDIEFESTENVFYVFLTQKETFMMHGNVNVQARALFLSGDVVGIDLGNINFMESTSKVVLK